MSRPPVVLCVRFPQLDNTQVRVLTGSAIEDYDGVLGMDILGTLSEITIDHRRQELQLRTQQPRFIRRL
jgi:hypothetical protein